MNIRRVVFITNARLPTERSHGVAIVKMCEALGALGIDVELWHTPARTHGSATPLDLATYYRSRPLFRTKEMPVLSLRWLNYLPTPLLETVALFRGLLRSLLAVRSARGSDADLYWSRDPSVAFWLGLFGLPFVLEIHQLPERGRRALLRVVGGRRSLRSVCPVTRFMTKDLEKLGFPPEKICVLPSGVDPELFVDLPDRVTARQRLGLPTVRPIIGYIGRMRWRGGVEKGIVQLMEAVSLVRARQAGSGEQLILVCVGGPADAVPEYQRRAAEFGLSADSVRFVDWVPPDEVPLWIRSCDVVTIPWERNVYSAFHTSPLKLFEYMAASSTIVASDLPSLREHLTHEENALLVEPGSVGVLAAAFERLVADDRLRAALAERARSNVEQYSWTSRAQRVIDGID